MDFFFNFKYYEPIYIVEVPTAAVASLYGGDEDTGPPRTLRTL